MYEIFDTLCKGSNVTPYKVGKETGIATSTFSDWKNGKSTPKQDKLKKIADYFGVSIEYLMTGKEPEKEILNPDTAKTLARLSRYSEELLKVVSKLDKLNESNRIVVDKFIDMMIENQENKEKPTKKLLVKRQEENKKTS